MSAKKTEGPVKGAEKKQDELHTEGPIGERDEVKKAEKRTQKLQEKTKGTLKGE